MNRLLAVAVVSAVTFFSGCSTLETAQNPANGRRPIEVLPPEKVAAATTSELTGRRAELHQAITEIQRQVEMKAGLYMGVAIHDDRAKLNELYLEARQIDRELLRRWQGGDGAARMETVKADL